MNEIIVKILGWIIHTALIMGGFIWSYRLGVKTGVMTSVIKVLKDEEIITENSSEKNL